MAMQILVVGMLVFAGFLVYMNHKAREEFYKKLIKEKKFKRGGESFILDKIITSQLAVFKRASAEVKSGVYKTGEKHEIYLAELVIDVAVGGSGGLQVARNTRKSDRKWVYTTLICYRSEKFNFPPVALSDENILNKISSSLGSQDIDFDDDPAFSNRFLLEAPSEVNAREFFTKSMRSFFVQNMPKGLIFETADDRFILRTNGYADKNKLELLVTVGEKFYNKLS